jgi:hypothetical protein
VLDRTRARRLARTRPAPAAAVGTTVALVGGRGVGELEWENGNMLITLAIVLIILWALGFLAFHVTSSLIHLLLVIAIIVIVVRLVTGRRPV